MSDVERLTRRFNRERDARKQAERLLEEKSLELYEANQSLEARVTERTETLQATLEQLQVEIVEREKTQKELAIARDAALESSRLKSEFLANMSHEIRTPMNAIIGLSNLLMDTELNAEQYDFLNTINNSADALLGIINDILDFSRIEADKLELEVNDFELHGCIEETMDLVAHKAIEKNIELACFIEPTTPKYCRGDITRLRQILINLLNNAIKFTEKGEVVLFVTTNSLVRDELELHFKVVDTGIGIPKDRIHRLFNSFSQVDASTTRKYGGTGLGLAISRRLSQLMGGNMWVESELNKGSTFHFTVKAQRSDKSLSTSDNATDFSLTGKRVLIVDDNETNRLILSRQTAGWDMKPHTLDGGPAALNLLDSDPYWDLAILDMQMPDMDGITLAKSIRDKNLPQPIPMILLSSIGDRPDEASRALFAAYANKPAKVSLLKQSILNALLEPKHTKTSSTTTNIETDRQKIKAERKLLARKMPLKLLLAEDNTTNQKVAVNMFKRFGYQIDIADNGVEVLKALAAHSYDVIFMDIQMPEMDGVEATRCVHEKYADNRPRIIAMTANAMDGDRENFLGKGMDDYISKPVKMDELEQVILRCSATA